MRWGEDLGAPRMQLTPIGYRDGLEPFRGHAIVSDVSESPALVPENSGEVARPRNGSNPARNYDGSEPQSSARRDLRPTGRLGCSCVVNGSPRCSHPFAIFH